MDGYVGNPLGEVCQYGLDYSNVPVKEPFDCLPTTSLIVQVHISLIMSTLYVMGVKCSGNVV